MIDQFALACLVEFESLCRRKNVKRRDFIEMAAAGMAVAGFGSITAAGTGAKREYPKYYFP